MLASSRRRPQRDPACFPDGTAIRITCPAAYCRLTCRLTRGLDWRGPCVLSTGRDRTDRRFQPVVSWSCPCTLNVTCHYWLLSEKCLRILLNRDHEFRGERHALSPKPTARPARVLRRRALLACESPRRTDRRRSGETTEASWLVNGPLAGLVGRRLRRHGPGLLLRPAPAPTA